MKKLIILMTIFTFSIINVSAASFKEVSFAACIDGDTIAVNMNKEKLKVRMLAIDTPETVKRASPAEPWGKEASKFTCEKISKAKKIVLEFDPNSDEKDKYGRYLAWVYVDDLLLQRELVKAGYAKVAYLYNDYLYTDSLLSEEAGAKADKRGIWGEYKETYIDKFFNFIERIIDIIIDFIEYIINIIERDIKSML